MKGWRCLCLIALCICGSLDAAELPPAEAFGRIPAESDVVLSPNGRWLAWLDNKQPKPRVIMFDVPGRKIQRVLAVPEDVKLRHLIWNDNETLLIVLSQTKESSVKEEASSEYFRVIAHDVSGGDGRMLPSIPADYRFRYSHQARLANLIAVRVPTPYTVIMATNDYCRCLWQVDTRTGNASTLRIGSEFTTGWVVDRSGRAVAREDWDWQHHAYRVFALPDQADEKLREIYRRDDSESPKLRGLLGDGSALVLLASSGHGYQAAWAVPLDGTAPRVIAEVPNADVTDVFIDPFSGAVAGVYTGGNPTEIKWLESTAQHRQEVLQRSFPGRQVSVYGWTSDATKTLARVETPSSPPVYYLVDFVSHRADVVAEEYPALASVKLGEKKAITYTARDGTAIPAYLTMPPVNVPGPIPLVVLPHGGPQARDHLEFDWLSQFIASRGYAVLQPQFRGSTGFGDAFREAGYRQWGGLMQDDVTDGVKAMIDQGIADARRVCIVGASYGGYAALAGAAFTPDIYACAVSIAGVSDLRALLHEQAPYIGVIASTSLSGWKEHIGSPHDASLGAKSPINSVKTIKSPVLIMYGTGDGVVPTDQSLRMAKALKDAGKEVKVVALRNEDHWLSRSETRVQVLKELETFLQAHLH